MAEDILSGRKPADSTGASSASVAVADSRQAAARCRNDIRTRPERRQQRPSAADIVLSYCLCVLGNLSHNSESSYSHLVTDRQARMLGSSPGLPRARHTHSHCTRVFILPHQTRSLCARAACVCARARAGRTAAVEYLLASRRELAHADRLECRWYRTAQQDASVQLEPDRSERRRRQAAQVQGPTQGS